MKNSTRLKLFVSFLLGLSGALFLTYASTNVSIQANVNTFVQFINRIVFTATTLAQRDALTPEIGTVIYNSDLQVHQAWNGTHWYNLGAGCTSIFEIQINNLSYGVDRNYGGGYIKIQGSNQGIIGQTQIGDNTEDVSTYNIYLRGNIILSPQETINLGYSVTEIYSNTLGWRSVLGGYIDTNTNTATIQMCGSIIEHELEVTGWVNGSMQVNQSGNIIIEARNTGIEDLENVQIWIDIPDHMTINNTGSRVLEVYSIMNKIASGLQRTPIRKTHVLAHF